MERARFALALERLQPGDWERFEHLAAAFVAVEFPALRTVAFASGDGGLDGYLYVPHTDPAVALQSSIAEAWPAKLTATARRLADTFPAIRQLIFVTNQAVGPRVHDARMRVRRDYGLFLDVWDRSWFLDRVHTHPAREAAAESLARATVDPLLAGRGVIEGKAQALTSQEARAALVYLSFQWEDEERGKGLTLLCFEALVRAVLRGTDSDHRLRRAEVRERVGASLQAHDPASVDRHVDEALTRLTKRVLRHWPRDDSFCLTYAETVRLRDRLAVLQERDERVSDDLHALRARYRHASPRLISRSIRDVLNAMRGRLGPLAEEQLGGLDDELFSAPGDRWPA